MRGPHFLQVLISIFFINQFPHLLFSHLDSRSTSKFLFLYSVSNKNNNNNNTRSFYFVGYT